MGEAGVVRVGSGFDAHRFGGPGPVLLAGVIADASRGLSATSDGDVVAHALCDALLGAASLGDMGELFPSSDPQFAGADSMALLAETLALVSQRGWLVRNADVTVVSQSVRVAPLRAAMRSALAAVLHVEIDAVSVKATTTDGMGAIGADEGLAVTAVVTLYA